MKVSTVCKVGAKRALTNYFRNAQAIDEYDKVLDTDVLDKAHTRLKTMLKDAYGLDREILNTDSTAPIIQFNESVIKEINQISGVYYREDPSLNKDMSDDNTLTPIDLVHKYVYMDDSPLGLRVVYARDFTADQLGKLQAGMRIMYPEVSVKASQTRTVDGSPRFSVTLEQAEEPSGSPIIIGDDTTAIDAYQNREMEVVTAALEPLLSKFKDVTINWVSPQEMQDMLKGKKPKVVASHGNNITGVAVGKDIYLVKGMVTPATAIEEFMHLFVDGLYTQRKPLYLGLLREATASYPMLAASIMIDYSDENGFTQEDRNRELVTKALRDAYIRIRNERPQGIDPRSFLDKVTEGFIKLSKEFFKWVAEKVGSALNLSLDTLPVETTITDIAYLLNVEGIEIPVVETTDIRFSVESGELKRDEFDDEDIIKEVAANQKKTVKDIKIERADDQYNRLYVIWEKIKNQNNPSKAGALASLYRLLQMTLDYKNNILQKDVKTISVTKFGGTPVFDSRFKASADASIGYGLFQHYFLEELMISALEADMTVGKFMRENPNFFEDFYNQEITEEDGSKITMAKKYLKYEGLTMKQLKDDIMQVADLVAADSMKGIIIPEVTIYGYDSNNRVVDGRLDYIIVHNDGKVEPVDFKTHKSSSHLKSYSSAPLTRKYQNKRLEEGVHPYFTNIPNRSKYTDYLTQVGIYARLLKQQGFNSLPGSIISTVYYRKPGLEEWIYAGAYVAHIPIIGEEGLIMSRDSNGNPTADVDPRYERIMNLIQDAIPIEGEAVEQNDAEELVNKFEKLQEMPVETIEMLNRNILAKIEQQLEDIRKQISEAEKLRADETKIKMLRDRKALLNEARINFMDNPTSEMKPEVILKTALEQVFQIISNLRTDSETISKSDQNLKTKISELGARTKELADMISFLRLFKETLTEANFPSDNFIRVEIDKALRDAQDGQKFYIEIAKDQMIKLLETVNPKLAEQMMESFRMYMDFRKDRLNRIVAGDASIFSQFSFWLGGKVNRVFNKTLSTVTPRTISEDMIEAAKEELKRIAFWEKNQKYDKNFVKMYVDSTWNDPESGFYIGSTITPREANWNGDDFVASFTNSELAIAAMAGYGIHMTETARMQFFQQMEEIAVEKLIADMSRKYGSYENAVAAISQEINMTDLRTNIAKRYRMFLTPELMEYYIEYDRLDYAVLSLKQEIAKVKEDGTLNEVDKKKQLDELRNKYDIAYKERKTWYLDNANTKLKREVYELEVQLPVEIQEKIDKLKEDIRKLLVPTGNEDINLKDSVIEEVQMLEYQIAKLRKQAIEENADLKEVFEKYQKYYSYSVNEKGWEYQREWHKKKWGEDSPQYKAWLKLNSDLVPVPSWYERMNELRKEKAAMFAGVDPVMDELFKRRMDLMEQYKYKSNYAVNRIFNPLLMSEEDYQELVEIEEDIEDRMGSSERPKVSLSKTQIERLDAIEEELMRISGKENKSSYARKFTDMRDELIAMLDEINKVKNTPSRAEELSKLEAQYATKEIAFQTWYNRNNKTDYKLGTLARSGTVSMDPRSFNVVTVPMDQSMMVLMPSSRWRTRSYREEAYNPEYSPSLMKRRYGSGSYAMPKGIQYNNKTGRYDVDPTSKWVNPRYAQMMKDPQAMDFYNRTVMDLYINKQAKMSPQKLGHFYPSVSQPGFESVAQEGWSGYKREWKELAENIKLNNSAIEQDTNEFGMLGTARIRFPHNSLWTADLTTKDGLNAILKWNLSYSVNQAMEEADVMMSPAIDYLKAMRERIDISDPKQHLVGKQVDKVIEIWEFERNKFIYGQTVQTSAQDTKSNVVNRKMFKGLMSLVSFSRLGFDPIMQTGNLISGNVQSYLAGEIARNGKGGTADLLWAKAQMYITDGFFYKVIANWGEITGVNLETKILRYFNPSMKDYDRLLDSTGRSKMRRLLMRGFSIKDVAFAIQDKGEMEIAMTTMLKNLHSHRYNVYDLDPQGNFIMDENGNRTFKKDSDGNIVTVTAYEALVDGPGAIPLIRKDVAMDMTDLDAIKFRTYNEYLMHQGNYSTYMKPRIESSVLGILIMFFRKYLLPSIETRFGGAFGLGTPQNWTSGDIQVGWWTAMREIFRYGTKGAILEAMLPMTVSKALGINELNLIHKSKAMQARRDVLAATVFTVVFATLRSLLYSNGDDEEDLTWAELQALRITAKVANESRSLMWIPVIGKADDYITNFSTFTSAFNEGKQLANLLTNSFWYLNAGVFDSEYAKEMAFYQRRAGRFDKGDPKVLANLLKLSGIENILDFWEPIFAAKEMYKRKS